MAFNNPAPAIRFCNKFYLFSSAFSSLLAPCVSLWNKRIVLKGSSSDIILPASSPIIFHFNFSTCCCWAVMTHGKITAVSPRMSEMSLEISLRNVLFEKPEVSLYLFLRKKGFGYLKKEQQSYMLTPNAELLGGLRYQLSLRFSPRSWLLLSSEGQKRFWYPPYSSQWQEIAECYKKVMSRATKSITGRLSWSFWPVGLMGNVLLKCSLESLYFQHLIMKIFTKENSWNSLEYAS